MSVAEQLADLARGAAGTTPVVLQNCRTAGFGTVGYGREEAAALFRAAPLALDPGDAVVTDALVALFGNDAAGRDAALFADVHDGHVMRLWVLGETRLAAAPLDETAVPADLVRDQRGARFEVVRADHPTLDEAAADRLRRLGQGWIDAQPGDVCGPLDRAVPVLLRAASSGARTAALAMLQGFAGTGGVARCAIGVALTETTRVVIDVAGRAAGAERRRVADLRMPPHP